jgi:hypothetical protein
VGERQARAIAERQYVTGRRPEPRCLLDVIDCERGDLESECFDVGAQADNVDVVMQQAPKDLRREVQGTVLEDVPCFEHEGSDGPARMHELRKLRPQHLHDGGEANIEEWLYAGEASP